MKNSIELVRQLVNDFKTHEATYLASDYQEQEARKDFIDKFLIALGWDVNHERQKNPYEQEVKIEQSVKTGKSQRRADYAFFIGPNFRDPKFFVEAKKPSRSLSNPDDYYQIIRYAYNKKIPISVLTDFEEFHIIDCRFMPDIKTALSRKIDYFHYSDYADEEKFSRLFHLFGREAVEKGSIEKYAAELPKPKGKGAQQMPFKGGLLSIDEAFLEKLDDFRLTLAKSFKKHNQELESEELTEAVQRTIDRLVFIRFLEDKGIEERVIEKLAAEPPAWKGFVNLCRSLEPKYNGLVFKHHALIDGDKFVPPEEEFAEICNELSDPSSPYLFDEIPISILGSIYERFLGKVVHATPKRADVEDKPEVRKAGGVYYTPEYIVRYIVQNTVGKLLRGKGSGGSLSPVEGSPDNSFGKTPEEISQMAFADIACGSGSFLIEVYSELLDYHTRYYSAYPEKAKPGDTQMREGKVVLSLKKRQEILTNNIYGVDIDYQATEVTQLSLYLKLLEDVTMNDAYQYSLLKEKILPDLKNNIKCGNSLIGTDILEGDLFEKTEERKLNPMNFADAFPKVMKRGGFDAIVGNPPYVNLVALPVEQRTYFQKAFKTCKNKSDLYSFFIERSLQKVSKKNFKFGYIVPHTWLATDSFELLRQLLLDNGYIESIAEMGFSVFENVVVSTVVLICSNNNANVKVFNKDFNHRSNVPTKDWINEGYHIDLEWNVKKNELYKKLKVNTCRLDSIIQFSRGIKTSDDSRFIGNTSKNKDYRKIFRGRNIKAYQLNWDGEYIWYRPDLMKEKVGCLPHSKEFFEVPEKLVTQRVNSSMQLLVAYDNQMNYFLDTTNVSSFSTWNRDYSLKFICGLLNSKLLNFWYCDKFKMPTIGLYELHSIPIRKINFSDSADKSRHDHIVKLVEQMLSAKEKLASAKLESEKDRLELLCSSLDRQIDEAVYELYGLTPEEIKVVEGEK